MNGMRRALGILLVIAGPVIVAIGYRNTPSASACAMANNIARELGESATCSATPSALYFAAGAVLLIAGLLVIVPQWRRAYPRELGSWRPVPAE
jgi:hypothetical protein